MAQRSSRSRKGKGRARGGEPKKQPQLRSGGGRAAKAQRARERQADAERSAEAGPKLRMRPAGAGGFALLLGMAWLGVALVAGAGLLLDRWNVLSYPDSLWLYVAFGACAVAPAVGSVARTTRDADSWGAQALLVPLGMLAAETVVGPDCPDGGSCGAIGARGAAGVVGSVVIVLLLGVAAWLLARWMLARAQHSRPARGRVRYGTAAASLALTMLLLGAPIAAAFVGLDIAMRETPQLAQAAAKDVGNYCFPLGAAPDLEVRPAPDGLYDRWASFAVRNANERRPGVGGGKLPTDWTSLDTLHPYEAHVAYASDGQLASLSCRKVSPTAGNATADDAKANEPTDNPLDPITTGGQFLPQFYTQGPKQPAAPATAKPNRNRPATR